MHASKPVPVLSMLTNTYMWNPDLVRGQELKQDAQAISAKGLPLQNSIGGNQNGR